MLRVLRCVLLCLVPTLVCYGCGVCVVVLYGFAYAVLRDVSWCACCWCVVCCFAVMCCDVLCGVVVV